MYYERERGKEKTEEKEREKMAEDVDAKVHKNNVGKRTFVMYLARCV